MANTLVIKKMNFATNRLAHVTFASIPCTGVSLSSSQYSISDLTPVQISYTLTPSNTTDEVTWSSSDKSVVTVVNGVMTIIGNGTATITVSCGLYSDSATVEVDIKLIAHPSWDWKTGILTCNDQVGGYADPSSVNTYKFITAFAKGTEASTYIVAGEGESTPNPYAFKIPSGVTKIKISATSLSAFASSGARVIWCKDESAGWSGYPTWIKAVSRENFDATSMPKEFTIPSGADCFIVCFKFNNDQSFTSAEDCAENYDIEIEFVL